MSGGFDTGADERGCITGCDMLSNVTWCVICCRQHRSSCPDISIAIETA